VFILTAYKTDNAAPAARFFSEDSQAWDSERSEGAGDFGKILGELLRQNVAREGTQTEEASLASQGLAFGYEMQAAQMVSQENAGGIMEEFFAGEISEEGGRLLFNRDMPLSRGDAQGIQAEAVPAGILPGVQTANILASHTIAAQDLAPPVNLGAEAAAVAEAVALESQPLVAGAVAANAIAEAAVANAMANATASVAVDNAQNATQRILPEQGLQNTAQGAGESHLQELAGLPKSGQPGGGSLAQDDQNHDGRHRQDSLVMEVRDLRSAPENTAAQRVEQAQVASYAGAETVQAGLSDTSSNEITMELRIDQPRNINVAAAADSEARSGAMLQDLLARELRQHFNGDMVRHASIALRDEGASTIRLLLKPETLGNVKISLEMAENKVTGLIVVESEDALRAFKREILSLEQAFKDSGFGSVELNLSLAQEGRNTEEQNGDREQFLNGQFAASRYDASDSSEPIMANIAFNGREFGAINVLA